MPKIPGYLLHLAGEYRVCSELNKRGIFATVTYGNCKSVDVYAISDLLETALKIEVKTSQQGNFVTRITQKNLRDDRHAPDFWVLFQIRPGEKASFKERFFVLTHQEICDAQEIRNSAYAKNYLDRHGKAPDFSTGVDNVKISDIELYEDQWSKIIERVGGAHTEE